MAQWVEDVAAEPGHQSLIPETHMEGETQLPWVVLWPPQVQHNMYGANHPHFVNKSNQ